MKLESIQKVHDGKYLKKYELTYLNKAGREKKYEIVSRKEIEHPDDLGQRVSGISIIAYKEDKMLLLREFRMAINREIYNLCAGMLEDGDPIPPPSPDERLTVGPSEKLDRVDVDLAEFYPEEFGVGTNGDGTASETRRA